MRPARFQISLPISYAGGQLRFLRRTPAGGRTLRAPRYLSVSQASQRLCRLGSSTRRSCSLSRELARGGFPFHEVQLERPSEELVTRNVHCRVRSRVPCRAFHQVATEVLSGHLALPLTLIALSQAGSHVLLLLHVGGGHDFIVPHDEVS